MNPLLPDVLNAHLLAPCQRTAERSTCRPRHGAAALALPDLHGFTPTLTARLELFRNRPPLDSHSVGLVAQPHQMPLGPLLRYGRILLEPHPCRDGEDCFAP